MHMQLIKCLSGHLKQKRKGAMAFEWMVGFPVTLLVLMVCVYMLLLFMGWTSYGALSSEIAKDVNTRSTGLIIANQRAGTGDVVMTGRTGYNMPYTIYRNQFKINGYESGNEVLNAYKNAVIVSARNHANQFFFPYCKFKTCNTEILQLDQNGSYNKSIDPNSTLSNYIVKVNIEYEYQPFSVGVYRFPGLTVTTHGYGAVD